MSEIEKRIQYRFRDPALLELALTHPSFRHEKKSVGEDNQRLEFLGDAVLGLVAADHLYERYPGQNEGTLTPMRSRLTSRTALARIARIIGLGEQLKMGKGESKSGGGDRDSNLSDALEALLGAAYLDGGLEAVQTIFSTVFHPAIDELLDEAHEVNPKGTLLEATQRLWKKAPSYHTCSQAGPDHNKTFTVEVRLNERVLGRGTGSSKRQAESEAARQALVELRQEL